MSHLTIFLRFLLLGALGFLPFKAAAQYTHSYSFPTAAGVGFRLTEPAAYDQSYHVKKTGNDLNPGTADQPLLTIGKALEKAKASLKAGKKTKILVHPGTYVESVKEENWNNGDNTTKRTLLCIEGQTATGSVVMQPRSDTHHALWLQGKHSLIIRNVIFDGAYQNNYVSEGGALLVTYSFWGNLRERYQDWLVENCEFKNGNGTGIAFHHNEYSTFRNLTVKDNKGGGGSVALRYCLMDGLTLTNNNLSEVSRFSNGGLFWISAHTVLRNSNMSGNKGAGLRMDHSCVNSVFENITADNNQDAGLFFETAPGPILVKNCRARNNDIGLILATVYDVVVDGCTFADNTRAQVEHGLMKRDDPSLCVNPTWYCTSSNYDTAPTDGSDWTNSLGLTSNRRIEMVNNTITTTKGATSYLVQFANTDRDDEYIPLFLTNDYLASNNRYFNPANDNVFGLTPNTFTDFEGWRVRTAKESGSIWGTGGPVPVAPALATPTVNGPNSIRLNWADNSSNETGFRVQRKRGVSGTYFTVANLGSGVTSFTNTGLTAGTQYYYRVKAVNGNGTTTSNEAAVTTSAAGAGDIAFAANAGGGLVIGSDGTSYEEDYHFSGGGTYTWTGAYDNTLDDALYGPERYGAFSYNVPLPNGSYDVTFKFADTKTQAGQRVFNVQAEGFALLNNVDIYARAGASYKAYDVTKRVTVTDGTLNLAFSGAGSPDPNPSLKGLLIRKNACTNCLAVTDRLDDWTKTHSRTNWYLAYDAQASANFALDQSRAVRNSTGTESIVYNYSQITDFSAAFIFHATYPATITFYTSPDNTTYTAIAAEYSSSETGGGWFRREYTPTAAIPAGTNFLKVEVTGGTQAWAPQLSQVRIQYGNASGGAFSGYYRIVARHSGKALDLWYASLDNGGNIVQHDYNGGDNQQWRLEATTDGYYKIISKKSNKAVDVSANSTANGANVQQWDYVGGNNQQWKLEATTDGYYKIIARHSGKALDVSANSTANGANVQQWDYVGGNNQQWKLEQVSATARMIAGENETRTTTRLAPNPARGETTFLYRATAAGKLQIVITDVLGRSVAVKKYPVREGENAIALDLAGFRPGVHTITATGTVGAPMQLKLVIKE